MDAISYVVVIPIFFVLGACAQSENNFNGTAFFWAVVAGAASILALLLMLFVMRSQPASYAVAVTAA